jgi:Rps23 Pro-64 3,4-dihydroxylase Tpa1-like proline 4-hydroxylase
MTTYKEIVVERGKKIYVFDDLFELEWRTHAYEFVKNSMFTVVGARDQGDIHYSEHQYLHSKYSPEDVERFGIVQSIKDEKLLSLITGKEMRPHFGAVVNLSIPLDTYFVHSHKNTTMLYYANIRWREDWGGETLFFTEDMSEVVYTSVYKPGRVIVFDGSIPHTIRPQSRYAPQYRFTFALWLNPGEGLE